MHCYIRTYSATATWRIKTNRFSRIYRLDDFRYILSKITMLMLNAKLIASIFQIYRNCATHKANKLRACLTHVISVY